jgi:23S rRNA (uracil1939-C5)-methyltransferase
MRSASTPSPAGEQLQLELTGMAYGGDAFGRDAHGRMVFVPFALPGELVHVQVDDSHRSWVRAHMIEPLRPSPDRIPPRCRHFTDCGGCHYQHLAYPNQLRVKRDIVQAQLERLGGFHDPPVHSGVASPTPWHTRNHMQFTLTDEGRLGFLAARSHIPLTIKECHLPEPPIADLWPRLDLDRVPGLERVSLRAGADDECLVIFESDRPPEADVVLDHPASAVWMAASSPLVLAGRDHIVIEVLDRPFRVSAVSFFQVHTSLAGDLVRLALEAAAIQPGQLALDLYSGVGLFSAFLAAAGARIIAVERSPSACLDFEFNLEPFEDVSLYEAPVEVALHAISSRPDAILLDPPRAGVGTEGMQRLIALQSPRIIYISCDPATLARDGRSLVESGYALRSVTPVDMFPQTYHIETVSLWTA